MISVAFILKFIVAAVGAVSYTHLAHNQCQHHSQDPQPHTLPLGQLRVFDHTQPVSYTHLVCTQRRALFF